jgi:YHS domain-containing protein
MKGVLAAFVIALGAFAQSAPQLEECIAKSGDFVVSYEGKTYRLANEACRAQFLTDPERYAQLYDALLELEREGAPLKPQAASLVPS